MGSLLLPPKVQREILKDKWVQQRAEIRAVIEGMLDFDDPVCREWAPTLKRLDPYLRLGRAKPMAYEPGFAVVPGFYHWVRDNPTAAPTVTAITGPDGVSFAEPDSGLLARLEANDLQRPDVWRALVEQQAVREREQEDRQEQERRELDAEVLERYKAVTRTQVSMDRDTPWAQNAAGYRRTKGAKRAG